MSAQSSSSGGPYRKPRLDIYTVMLTLALVAIIIACIVLYAEVADYGKPPYQVGLAAPRHADPAAATVVPRRGPEAPWSPCLAICCSTLVHG